MWKRYKKAAQDWLMRAVQRSMAALPSETVANAEFRAETELQFRRVEKRFKYVPDSWPIHGEGHRQKLQCEPFNDFEALGI